jgi:streptogramin lyase
MNGGIVMRGVAGLVGLATALAGVAPAQGQNYQWARTVSTYGSGGTSTFNSAQSVTVDPSGNVWATDQFNSNLVKFGGSGNWLTSFPLSYGDGLHSDASGNIWVAGVSSGQHGLYGCITEVSSGSVLPQISTGSGDFPSDVATDPSGNIWATFWESTNFNQVLAKYSSSGTLIGWYGSGITGGGSTSLFDPCGLAIDKSGNVWVSDGNNRIVEFNNSGTFLQQFGSSGSSNGQLLGNEGLAFDSAGNLWVANGNNNIVEFSSAGAFLGQFGSLGTGPGQFNDPQGVAFDAAGNMWVADTNNNRLQEFSPVPEPSTLVLLAMGAVSLLAYAWRRRTKELV